eukprot:jgi/Chrpa1/20739/Chrysochromulina_OHIO_Genome00022463-RA
MRSTHASSPLDEALLPSDNVPPSWYLPRLFRQPIFVLLPLGVIGPLAGWFKQLGDLATFAINLTALAPLALLLATATDELGKHTGQTFAGLINASMGNAFELIISLQALRAGLLRLLQLQLLGSILANALLLTGACFVAGGIAQHTQQFDRKTVFVTSAALLVAVLALCIPTAYTATQHHSGCPVPCVSPETLHISRWASLFLVVCYAIYLYWSTATHPAKLPPQSPGRGPQLSLISTISLTALATSWIALCSGELFGDSNQDDVKAIEGAAAQLGVSPTFVALVLLPIVGNAAESYAAMSIAYRGRMDMALGTALGSALQLSLGIVPLLVLICWGFAPGLPLSLDFHPFEVRPPRTLDEPLTNPWHTLDEPLTNP